MRTERGVGESPVGLKNDARRNSNRIPLEDKAFLSAAYQNAPLVMITVDEERRVVRANRSALAVAGRPSSEIMGLRGGEALCCLHAADHADGCGYGPACGKCTVRGAVVETLETGRSLGRIEGSMTLRRDGGVTNRTILVSTVPVTVSGADYVQVYLDDITERRKAEEDKTRLEAQVRRAQRLETIGVLAGGIAHDFNNLLAPIIGYTDLVLSKVPDVFLYTQELKHVLSAAERAKDLVQQILLFSKQSEREREPCPVQSVLRQALALLRPTIPATVDITTRIDDSCGPVLADPTQLHQVVANLCTNAWQAMKKGGGTITLELCSVRVPAGEFESLGQLPTGEYVRLSVIDTGPGMDGKTLEHIFEPFFTTKPVGEGTGLGLSVVHGIVQSHGGGRHGRQRVGGGHDISRLSSYHSG